MLKEKKGVRLKEKLSFERIEKLNILTYNYDLVLNSSWTDEEGGSQELSKIQHNIS